ncbi:MAG: ABC transporter substrate-binding protein [Anaerolineae bacterium]|nr:ABC transporter substrate-binding protein [Anaerolineae bacterium]
MEFFSKKETNEAHPYIPELKDQYQRGRITRREFLRNATLLGMTFTSASAFLAACGPTTEPTAVPAATEPTMATAVPQPTEPPAGGPIRGGSLKAASRVQKVTHPAQFSWIAPSNQLRQVAEYLTYYGVDNVARPLLLESWEPSDDLKTWTLNLRQGIMHNNGDEFNADDVLFTMKEWLNEEVGSSMLGLIGDYLSAENIEKVDDYTVRLNLSRPEIAVPEHLFHYPALVLNHRTFEGDFIRAPHGTGPYTLESYSEGERVLLRRRNDYWQTGADGDPLPYLDEMEFIDMGEETSAWIAAIQAGEVDYLDLGDNVSPDFYLALKDDPNVVVATVPTGTTRVLRMRVDIDPWTDNNVCMALKLCQNHEKILNLAYFGQGLQGQDMHVYENHPEYCSKPVPQYDPERAKQLLADAGYPDGLDVQIAVGTGWPDIVSYAEILKEDAAAAGFNITLNTMPNSQYWEQWTEVDLGVTPWTHRPLGTMILNLAYTADAEGNPVAWNESRWVDPEFSELLTQANGTLDVEARRQIFCDLEQIQMDRGSIGIPYWMSVWMVHRKSIMDVPPHANIYMLFNEVWKSA